MDFSEITPQKTGGRYEYYGYDMLLILDSLEASGGGLKAWVELRWSGNVPNPKVLAFGRYDLMGSRTVSSLVNAAKGGHVEEGLLKEFASACIYDVVRDNLEGEPAIVLADVQPEPDRWLVYPLVGTTGASSLIAPGGSTKSFLALALGLTVATGRSGFLGMTPKATGPVIYLDWEADRETHAERMRALCAPKDVPLPETLLYRAERQSLHRSANTLEKLIAKEGAIMVIVDSVMLARGGEAFGDDTTTKMYGALRQLGVPAILVDHKSREAIRKKWSGAYGSVVNDNSARLQWEYDAIEEQGDNRIAIRLTMTKRNNTGKQNDLGFEIGFTNSKDGILEEVKFRRIEPTTITGIGVDKESTAADQIVTELRHAGTAGMLVKEIAEAIDIGADTVRSRLADMAKRGAVSKSDAGRATRWYAVGEDKQRKVVNEPEEVPW